MNDPSTTPETIKPVLKGFDMAPDTFRFHLLDMAQSMEATAAVLLLNPHSTVDTDELTHDQCEAFLFLMKEMGARLEFHVDRSWNKRRTKLEREVRWTELVTPRLRAYVAYENLFDRKERPRRRTGGAWEFIGRGLAELVSRSIDERDQRKLQEMAARGRVYFYKDLTFLARCVEIFGEPVERQK